MVSTRVRAYGAHVLRKSGGVAPWVFLCLEVSDAVCLGVWDVCSIHGGFPADALLAGRFDLV